MSNTEDNTDTPAAPKVVSPTEAQDTLRARLEQTLDEMRTSPWLPQITAHIEAHDLDVRVGENQDPNAKELQWVLDVMDTEGDPLDNAKTIENAHRVFTALAYKVSEDLVPFAVAALESRLQAVRDNPAIETLTGKVMAHIADPGDLTVAANRGNLEWALGVAEHKLSDTVDITELVEVMTRVMAFVDPWFGYGWDGMLESHEAELAERTANRERPYTPFKVAAIQEALDTIAADAAEGQSNFRALMSVPGKRKALVVSVKGFRQTLDHNGQRLFDGDVALAKRFDALLAEVAPGGNGNSSQAPAGNGGGNGGGPRTGRSSRSSAAKRKSTPATAAEKEETAKRTAEKPYVKTGPPTATGPEATKTTRGRAVADAGKSRADKAKRK